MIPKIKLYCNCKLQHNGEENETPDPMELDGPLYLNKDARLQSQNYKCPICDASILLVFTQ